MNEIEFSEPAWFCVRTQTKREHIAAGYLRELEGIEVFCPRLRYRKATRRGTVWWLEPLFPGYVLAKFNLMEFERAVTFCQGVRGLVRFGSEIPSVPESFVQVLRDEIRGHVNPDNEILTVVPALECGDEVEVASGPLAGMHGVVVSIAPAAERVKILLDFLGQPQAIDMDLFSILLPRRPIP
ncbi:MAG: transcription termination/antitermination NusG family protein [Verrucomicrobiota bacterium]